MVDRPQPARVLWFLQDRQIHQERESGSDKNDFRQHRARSFHGDRVLRYYRAHDGLTVQDPLHIRPLDNSANDRSMAFVISA